MTATTDRFIQLKNEGRISSNEFTGNLAAAIRRGVISDGRMFWIDKLVKEAEAKQVPAPVTLSGDVQGIFTLFDAARSKGIKYPKVRLQAEDGTPVVFKQAGERSKYFGQILLTDGLAFGSNRFFGRIDEAGRLIAGRDLTDSVAKLVSDFAANPAQVGAAYGKRTGTCCFCSRHLETKESVFVGYGPICAEKFGLPWGQVSEVEVVAPAVTQEPEYVLPSFVTHTIVLPTPELEF